MKTLKKYFEKLEKLYFEFKIWILHNYAKYISARILQLKLLLHEKYNKYLSRCITNLKLDKYLKKYKSNKISANKVLRFILVIIFIISLGILLIPQIPEIEYKLNKPENKDTPDYPVSYINENNALDTSQEKIYVTESNRLYIPKIGVETKILEGDSENVMDKEEGVWRDPTTSDPESLGNMVLAGHRFQFLPPNTTTLYHLDKLKIGDSINIYWEGKEYVYKIFEIFEVKPDEVWIKDHSISENEITIYTCTPIYTSERRLVVRGRIV